MDHCTNRRRVCATATVCVSLLIIPAVVWAQATITGTVETAIQKRLAERIADRTDGISTVENRVKIDPELVVAVIEPMPGYASYVADATIEAMVDSKLLWNQYTDGLDITVSSDQGASSRMWRFRAARFRSASCAR